MFDGPVQPKTPDPIKVPSPNDPEVLAQRRQSIQDEFAKRQGRASTDLTSPASAPTYSRTALG